MKNEKENQELKLLAQQTAGLFHNKQEYEKINTQSQGIELKNINPQTVNDLNFMVNEVKYKQMNEMDVEKRFMLEKEVNKKVELQRKIHDSKSKKKKEFTLSLTSISEHLLLKKIKIVDFIIFILVIINIGLSLAGNNIYTASGSSVLLAEFKSHETIYTLRWIIIGVVALMEILIIYRYVLELKRLRAMYLACKRDSFLSTGLWKGLIIEFIVLGVLCPPRYDGTIEGRMFTGKFVYSYDSLFFLFILFKLYTFGRIYTHMSMWTSAKVQALALENKININIAFSLKAELKRRPSITIILMLFFTLTILGFMMRIFEYGYSSDPGAIQSGKSITNPNFRAYLDTFWVIIITMMTVGYGDIYPNTHLGRIIAFLSSITGMVIVSLLIVSLSYLVEFSPEEKKAYNMMKKSFASDEKNKISSTFVKSLMKLYLVKKSDYYSYHTKNRNKKR